jgi:long-chain fatty acid transport protein
LKFHQLLALSFVATAASPAYAAGYFMGEKGAHAAGRAGAFTAKADDIMAVAYNPAGLSDVGTTVIQLGNRFSYNSYEFTRKPTLDWGNQVDDIPPYVTFDTVENETPWQALDPLIGVATNFGLKDWGFAFAIYSPPGVSKMRFPIDGGQRYMMVEREALIVNYNLSAAWEYQKLFGVGLTFQIVAVPSLKYSLVIDGYGMTNPDEAGNGVSSERDMHAETSGSDLFTPQIILGGWYRPAPFLEVGVSGQILPTSIQTDSELEIDPFSDALGDAVLERDGEPANDVDLELPLPITARVGVRYIHLDKGSEVFDVELDVAYEAWSRVEAFELRSDNLIATVEGEDVPVGDITIEKKWRDTLSVHLGGDYAVAPGLATLRGGVSYESAVASPAYMNVDFMGGAQLGLAMGGSVFVDKFEFALAYGFRHMFPVRLNEADGRVYPETPASTCDAPYTGPTCNEAYLGQPGPVVNAGEYRAFSHAASLDVAYKF